MKNKRLIIIGAGGHGRVCEEIAGLCGYQERFFLDDNKDRPSEFVILGNTADFEKYIDDSEFFVAIGDNRARRRLQENIVQKGGGMATLIHPQAVVSASAVIGKGAVVMAGAVVNPGAVIGDGVIINTCSSVDHECNIGAFVHIAVGAHLAGLVDVGENTFFGAGSTAVNHISVSADTIIGAGAVVVNDVKESGTYVGVPAVKIK